MDILYEVRKPNRGLCSAREQTISQCWWECAGDRATRISMVALFHKPGWEIGEVIIELDSLIFIGLMRYHSEKSQVAVLKFQESRDHNYHNI